MKTHIKKILLFASLIIFAFGNSVNVMSVKANDITIPIGEVPEVYSNQGYIIFEISTSKGPYTILQIGNGGFKKIILENKFIEFFSNDYGQKTYVDTDQNGTWDLDYDRKQVKSFEYNSVPTVYYYSTCDVTDSSGSLVFHQPHWMGHTRAVKGTMASWMALAIYSLADLTTLVMPFLVLVVGFRMSYRLLLNCLQKS